MVPGGVPELDVACQQLIAERLRERDLGGVVRAEIVPQFPAFGDGQTGWRVIRRRE
jgi:hypothetical protein